jgi:hypothetical protein
MKQPSELRQLPRPAACTGHAAMQMRKKAQGQNGPIMSKIHVFLVQIILKEAKIL